MILPVLGVVALAGVTGFLLWERHDMAVARIHGELLGRKARDITTRLDLLDFDRDNLTYDVEYTAADGIRKANRCKVAVRGFADDGIYWESPI